MAGEIVIEASKQEARWPDREEVVSLRNEAAHVGQMMDGAFASSPLAKAFAELQIAASALERLSSHPFFNVRLAKATPRAGQLNLSTLAELVSDLTTGIRRDIATFESRPAYPRPTSKELLSLLPAQQLGPVEFVVAGTILKINHRAAIAGDLDSANADRAREELIIRAVKLKEELEGSNFDKRLIELVADINERLKSRADIIALGIQSMTLQVYVNANSEELPGIVSAYLQAFSVTVAMYVAQFPEWNRYNENAAMAEYTTEDLKAVYQAGTKLVADLVAAKDAVDPEVPRTIRWMLEAMRERRSASKRAVFGALRTIENLVNVVFTTFGGWLGAADEGVKKGIKTGIATTVAVTVVMAAVDVASSISPSAARVTQASWLSIAVKMVTKALEEVSKE
ncbi:hypothetical protein [uncultured Sphingomonas sp.]|uniref:hypothetical protein n=1 Tax=uncultured Sphingomonas sp. TaxID=158754 RepID=UPI00262AED40|nr:hypothetical protein [uncultured Sphingomonas sp.]